MSRDDVGIVERGNHGAAVLERERGGMLKGVVVRLTVKDDVGAVPARRLGFGARCRRRHDDDRGNVGPAGGHRDALGVVSRARGDDATLPLLRRQVGDPEPGSAQLERARVLEQLGLEVDVADEQTAQRVRVDEPRVLGDAVQDRSRLPNVVKSDHHVVPLDPSNRARRP